MSLKAIQVWQTNQLPQIIYWPLFQPWPSFPHERPIRREYLYRPTFWISNGAIPDKLKPLWNTKVGEREPSTHPTQCQWIRTLLYVKQGVRWQTATVNSLTASPSSPFRLPKQRWGQPRDRSQEEHSEAQHSQLEHSCHVELCDRLPFCRIFHIALSSLVPRRKIFCSRCHAWAFFFPF